MKHVFRLLLCALAACSVVVGETPTETIAVVTTTTSSTTSTTVAATPVTTPPPKRVCTPVGGGTAPIATGSVAGDALALSREIFPCADHAVVVAETNLDEIAVAAQLAAALGGPLLHPHPELAGELERLDPLTVHLMGGVEVDTPVDAGLLRPGVPEAVALARNTLGATGDVPSHRFPMPRRSSRPSGGSQCAIVWWSPRTPQNQRRRPFPLLRRSTRSPSSAGSPPLPGPNSPGWFQLLSPCPSFRRRPRDMRLAPRLWRMTRPTSSATPKSEPLSPGGPHPPSATWAPSPPPRRGRSTR